MRPAVLRAITASLLLGSAIALPAAPAVAAAGPHLDVTPPAVVGTGLNPVDLPVQVVNTGGPARSGVRLRLTVTPVAGSDLRPLDPTLLLTYSSGSRWRQLDYVTNGNTLVATTPALSGVDADGTATFRLQISGQASLYAPHVDKMTVDVATEALDDTGVVFAADSARDRISLVEPLVEVSGVPSRIKVGAPAVLTVSVTNTTPLEYLFMDPAVTLFGVASGYVVFERLDGTQWTPVERLTGNNWYYAASYAHLQPGDKYSAKLRITFTNGAPVGTQGNLYHLGYRYPGYAVGAASQPFTIDPPA